MRERKIPIGDFNTIGQKVTLLRQQKQMSQGSLHDELRQRGIQISPSGLSKLEGQRRLVSDRELKLLCDVLGVTPDYLLGYPYSMDGFLEALAQNITEAQEEAPCALCAEHCGEDSVEAERCRLGVLRWIRQREAEYQSKQKKEPPEKYRRWRREEKITQAEEKQLTV